jgi:pantothenate kinase type III
MHRALGDPAAPCLLSGGAAPALAQHLALPVRPEPHLVLHGLACIGYSS